MSRRVKKFASFEVAEKENRSYISSLSPAKRIEMVWPLTLTAFAFTGKEIAESRLQRHLVRIYRPQS